MKKITHWALCATLAATVSVFSACSPKNADSADSAVQEAAADLALVASTPQDAALYSAQRLLAALSNGDLAGFYTLLPASYRNDISSVVQTYASKIDPELVDMFADALSALGGAVDKQAANIFELVQSGDVPFEIPEEAREQVTVDGIRQFGQFIATAPTWLNSEQLAQGDIAGLLSNPQIGAVLKDAFASNKEFVQTRFRLAETQPEDPSRVALESGSDEFGWDSSDMVLVEGCWVPEELVEGWGEMIADAMAGSADFAISEEDSDEIRAVLPALKQSFAVWADAPSAEALTQQVVGTFMMLGALSM